MRFMIDDIDYCKEGEWEVRVSFDAKIGKMDLIEAATKDYLNKIRQIIMNPDAEDHTP